MSAEHPVLMVYDKEGIYYDLLSMLQEKGVKVIDTTQSHLHARLSAQRYWCKELSLNKDARMVIYRKLSLPNNKRSWVEEPYAAFMKGGCIFPQGSQDRFENLCRSFLPAKQKELDVYNGMAREKIILSEETEIRYALAVCYLALIEEVEKYVRYEPDNPIYIRNTVDARDMYDMAFKLL